MTVRSLIFTPMTAAAREAIAEPETQRPADRLDLFFGMKADAKHVFELFEGVARNEQNARAGAEVLARAAARFATRCRAFADAQPKED